MEPMKPMEPMAPMKPMSKGEAWWPKDLGEPSTSGSQNDLRYAFFSDAHRLVIQRDGETSTYDSGDHRIQGVSQASAGALRFTAQDGEVDVASLKKVS